MELLVIIWLLCAIGTAMIAKSKHKEVGTWFFIGLIFGIFGLIAIALAKDESAGSSDIPSDMPKNSWKCPKCGFVNPPWMEKCGARVDRGDGAKVVCGTSKNPIEKKCPQCAEMVKYEAKICRFCQYKFEEVPTT